MFEQDCIVSSNGNGNSSSSWSAVIKFCKICIQFPVSHLHFRGFRSLQKFGANIFRAKNVPFKKLFFAKMVRMDFLKGKSSLIRKTLTKMCQPRPLFVYFRSFQTQILQNNGRFQRDLNSNHQSRRRAR